MKINKIEDLNRCLEGRDLYILGSGPALNELTTNEIEFLGNQFTIGVNRVQYIIDVDLFLSAYAKEVLSASNKLGANSTLVHLRSNYGSSVVSDAFAVKRRMPNVFETFPRAIDGENPEIVTRKNVLFAALSLALVMKPKRVFLYGFEQRNLLHFFDLNESLKKEIFLDYVAMYSSSPSIFTVDKPNFDFYSFCKNFLRDKEELEKQSFYDVDHTEMLKIFFAQIRDEGIEVMSSVRDSVAVDAGAIYAPIGHADFYSSISPSASKLEVKRLSYLSAWVKSLRHTQTFEAYKGKTFRVIPRPLKNMIKKILK